MNSKGLFKRLSAFLTAAACAVGLIGGSGGAFFNAQISAAADDVAQESSQQLEPGTYVVPLYQVRPGAGVYSTDDNKDEHFNSRAKLVVDENGTQTVTIGVENWDYYEAFIPMSQQYNQFFGTAEYGRYETAKYNTFYHGIPEKPLLMMSQAGNEYATHFLNNPTEYVDYASYTSQTDNFFKYGDTKYGDISVDRNTKNINDSAYISFTIDDYTEEFAIFAVTNHLIAHVGYVDVMNFMLDTASMFNINDLQNAIDNNDLDYQCLTSSSGFKSVSNGSNPVTYLTEKAWTTIVFDGIDTEIVPTGDGGNKVIAKYHLSGNKKVKDANAFKEITSIREADDNDVDPWNIYRRSEFSNDLEISDGYVTIEYDYDNIEDLIFGKYVFFSLSKYPNNYYGSQYVLTPKSYDITLSDDATGVRVVFNNRQVADSDNVILKVEKNVSDENTKEWESGAYDLQGSTWYKLYLYNSITGEAVNPIGGADVFVPIPEAMLTDTDGTYMYDNKYPSGKSKDTVKYTTDSATMSFKYSGIGKDFHGFNGNYIAILKLSSNATQYIKENIEDGVYKASAVLYKISEAAITKSMADPGFDPDVRIVVKDGVKKLYFKAGDIGGLGYIGDLMCDDEEKGSAYYDSVSYTKFSTFDDGSLISNAAYDPITEWACLEGGIITLKDESYFDGSDSLTGAYYKLAICAPPMAAMGGQKYEEVAADDLAVKLTISNVVKLNEATEEDVLAEYGYDKSALRRKIDLAKRYLEDELDYTIESVNELKTVVDYATTIYEGTFSDKVTASNAYEEQINLVQAAIDALVLDESAIGDKTELEALVAKAKAIGPDEYTNSTYAALQEAIAAAEKVLAKDAVKQSRLDEQVKALQSAIDALEKKPETALDKDNLADGKYTLTAEMIKTDRKSKSMSNNAINHTVQLEVVDGEYFVTVQFKGLAIYNQFGYLKDLGYYDAGYTYNDYGIPQGTVIPAEVLSYYDVVDQYNDADNLYPQLLRFRLVDKASADFVPLQVFVPIMEAIAEGTGTQDVLMQLDWSTLVKVDDDAPIDIEEPEEQSPAVDLTDAATGVKIHADKGVFEEGVQLVVTPVTSGSDFDNAKKALDGTAKAFSLYEIHFIDKDGNTVQPNGTVSVSIPVPSDYSDKLAVYRINDNAGKTLMSGEAKDGFYTYLTKSFSLYALADTNVTESSTPDISNTDNSSKNDNSSKGNNNSSSSTTTTTTVGTTTTSGANTENPATGAAAGFASTALLAAGILIVSKKRKEK